MDVLASPLQSLEEGHWFKLICGASYQHLPAVRNLVLVYSLAGADCVDVAADPGIIRMAQQAMAAAAQLRPILGWQDVPLPLLMVSLNDGEDPHFRKATFDPSHCPPDCPQPCVQICPADAIAFPLHRSDSVGILTERCYGCGRCLPICPLQRITTQSHLARPETLFPLIETGVVQAVEIHTQVGHFPQFQKLWQTLQPVIPRLQVIAISCPDHPDLLAYLGHLYQWISPLPCPLIWQTDGRPMSGDIGKGATRATVNLAQKVLQADLPGYVQLAGGTNYHTIAKLKAKGLLHPRLMNPSLNASKPMAVPSVAGVAYGSFARQGLAAVQTTLETQPGSAQIEDNTHLLHEALSLALALVRQLKPHLSPVLDNLPSAGLDGGDAVA